MKKLKLAPSAEPASETTVSRSLHKISSLKKLLIIPTVQNSSSILANLHIKNQHFFKINFNGLPLSPGFLKIVKRNTKYLKGTENYHFKSSPSLSLCNLANGLEFTPSSIFSNSGKILELPTTLSSATPPGKEHTVKCLKDLIKSNLTLKTFKLKFLPLDEDDDVQRKLYAKLLQKVFLLRLSSGSFYGEYWIMKKNEESLSRDFAVLSGINSFANLQNVAFELNIRGCQSETLYNAFEPVSEINNLQSLKLSMDFQETDKKGRNMKKTIAKFQKLTNLHLQLTFPSISETLQTINDPGKIFTSLASFKFLKHLNLEILSGLTLDCSETVKFIISHKNLETLRLTTRDMRFDEYVELFKGVQKMKSLTELSIVQTHKFYQTFAYGPVFKTLEALKKLKSLTLDLGHYSCDGKEMNAVFQHLVKHPSLEKVNLILRMDGVSKHPYNFDNEFFEDITHLRKKLHLGFKFKFIIYNQPEFVQAYEKVSKIINPTGKRNELFSCSKEICC